MSQQAPTAGEPLPATASEPVPATSELRTVSCEQRLTTTPSKSNDARESQVRAGMSLSQLTNIIENLEEHRDSDMGSTASSPKSYHSFGHDGLSDYESDC